MKLRILLPTEVLVDVAVSKIVAESARGSFCLLPRHIDFVEALARGILTYSTADGDLFVALDGGILVKKGDEVTISTPRGVQSRDLSQLEEVLHGQYTELGEREKRARTAVVHLEAELSRKFLALRDAP